MGGRSGNRKVNRAKNFNLVNGIRLALEEEEKYAVCIKLFGGGMCSVKCEDGICRTCVMRSKFRGKDRRDNMITQGSLLLVGIRDWERVTEGKPQKCDLLEVYKPSERESLLQLEKRDLSGLGILPAGSKETSDFDFVDEKTYTYRQMIEALSDGPDSGTDDEDEGVIGSGSAVDIDDI